MKIKMKEIDFIRIFIYFFYRFYFFTIGSVSGVEKCQWRWTGVRCACRTWKALMAQMQEQWSPTEYSLLIL